MQRQSTPTAQLHAKALRKTMTDSEHKLWSALRSLQFGVKFRKQHPLGNFITDFACLNPKLVVELDGSQHAGQAGYDARREAYLRAQGFAVLRFPTNAPLVNLAGVLTVIADELRELAGDAPNPDFPQRGKENENTLHSAPNIPPSPSGGRPGWGHRAE